MDSDKAYGNAIGMKKDWGSNDFKISMGHWSAHNQLYLGYSQHINTPMCMYVCVPSYLVIPASPSQFIHHPAYVSPDSQK